ncbi:efflux RND transporter periplasmic adaptor subunit [Litchfieldella xinjiangensis]|uniref:efflux RND transporter periplasmic adaptor subunit n=1 Tax=Litchfieldella xinjiangensis TaxID=1166948 RepID=UPI000AC3B8C5|nr:efflux RND transporter periplasmic adaptor subunit [Halomonas xinjiangensis]
MTNPCKPNGDAAVHYFCLELPMSRMHHFRFQTGRVRLGGIAALLIMALGLGMAWWLFSQPPRVERRPAPPTPPPLVDIIEVERGPAAPRIEGYGRVIAERDTALASRVGGRLVEYTDNAEPGRVVEAGETLARLDDRDYQLALRIAQAELAQAEAGLATERGEQLRAQSEYQSFGRDLPAERRALVLREPQLKSAQADLARAQVALEQARLDLERTELTAPYRGMIQERLVGSGSEVSANTELLRLVDVAAFWVRVSLPGEMLTWIAGDDGDPRGTDVTLTSRGWPAGSTRSGQILSVLPALEENGLQAQVLVRVEDPLALAQQAPALRLGDLVQVSIAATPREGLFVLPAHALRPGDEVWRLDAEDRLERVRVDIVHRGEDRVLIASGLEPADRVVVSGLGQPRSGMALRAQDTAQRDASGSTDTGETSS